MDKVAWIATLEYWRESGMAFRSGDRLEFPPPRPSIPPRPVFHHREVQTSRPPTPVQPTQTPKPQTPKPQTDTPLPPLVLSPERPPILAKMAQEVASCERCNLSKTRTQTVFGVGSADASVVFVGEGPGADEDLQGEPFVGAAGKLFDQMLRSISLDRSQVFIANVVKCRPPGNRNPHTNEISSCQTYLFHQLELIRPKVIFCLGKFALLCLAGYSDTVGKARGQSFQWRGIPLIASYHPAYYLRNPRRKDAAWQDLIQLIKFLERA